MGKKPANPRAARVSGCPVLKKKWAKAQKKWAEKAFLIHFSESSIFLNFENWLKKFTIVNQGQKWPEKWAENSLLIHFSESKMGANSL